MEHRRDLVVRFVRVHEQVARHVEASHLGILAHAQAGFLLHEVFKIGIRRVSARRNVLCMRHVVALPSALSEEVVYYVVGVSQYLSVAVGTHYELPVVEPPAVVEQQTDASAYYAAAVLVDARAKLASYVAEKPVERPFLTLRHVQSLVGPVSEESVSADVLSYLAAGNQLFSERHYACALGPGVAVEADAVARTEKQHRRIREVASRVSVARRVATAAVSYHHHRVEICCQSVELVQSVGRQPRCSGERMLHPHARQTVALHAACRFGILTLCVHRLCCRVIVRRLFFCIRSVSVP